MTPRPLIKWKSFWLGILVLGIVAFFALRTTSYQRFEKVRIGERFEAVSKRIDEPFEPHDTGEFIDYLFFVKGSSSGYPRLFGVDFPVARIVRVKNGIVVDKGRYEDFYDAHAPGWVPKNREGSTRSGP